MLAATLPQRAAGEPAHDRAVCLDLLRAKLAALDRHAPFPYSDAALCERCRALLGTLDLAGEGCAALAVRNLPPGLRERVLGVGGNLSRTT